MGLSLMLLVPRSRALMRAACISAASLKAGGESCRGLTRVRSCALVCTSDHCPEESAPPTSLQSVASSAQAELKANTQAGAGRLLLRAMGWDYSAGLILLCLVL